MYDCVCVDFNINGNRKKIEKIFPHAKFTPFVDSYFDILKSYISEIKTSHFWFLTTLDDLSTFDFDFVPEQHQDSQIHLWHNAEQKEGNLFLIPTNEFKKQLPQLKHLRDFADINYHQVEIKSHKWPEYKFEYSNLYQKVKNQKSLYAHYFFESTSKSEPSLWEDKKLYVNNHEHTCLTIPKLKFQKELYEYERIYFVDKFDKPPKFDIFFLHNNEPQALANLSVLKEHLGHIGREPKVVSGINGRDNALRHCAKNSTSEYFYVVPAKLEIDPEFKFNYTPSTLKSNRHYIFGCYNRLISYMYGHQAVVLYFKEAVLNTPSGVLDFTLHSPHEYVNERSGYTNFFKDSKVNYRTTFREVVKLLYQKHTKPTVEGDFILEQWKSVDNIFTKKACTDAETFCSRHNYSLDKLLETFDWEFVDRLFLESFGQ